MRAGERVELVALLDAATPQAAKRAGRMTKERARRFAQVVADARSVGHSTISRGVFIAHVMTGKIANAFAWEITHRVKRWSVNARFRLLRMLLARQRPWPRFVPELSVRQIYESAERLYTPAAPSRASVVLARAKAGQGADTPYREIYTDETLGWASVTNHLSVVDVEGGHSSMLQEPLVGSLANALLPHFNHPKPAEPPSVVAARAETSSLLAET
jgi:thioesterase domain-containing protein